MQVFFDRNIFIEFIIFIEFAFWHIDNGSNGKVGGFQSPKTLLGSNLELLKVTLETENDFKVASKRQKTPLSG